MFKGKKVLAIIPARAGSKGIKDKNIIDLVGKPLIAHSIEQGLNSKYIDKVVVSTDGEKIAEVAKQYGAEVPFLRPSEIACDTAKTIDVMIHCVDFLNNNNEEFDYIVLLQPTQPLRKVEHIDEMIEKIVNEEAKGIVSVCKVKEHPILMRTIDDKGKLNNLLSESSTMRRQEMPDYYKVNGVIYVNKIDKDFKLETSLNDNKLAYVMEEKYSIDIDDLMDLEIARLMHKEICDGKRF
ncbi:MAG: cytidylyltransferase domain-containing protein [Sarcina sp.]